MATAAAALSVASVFWAPVVAHGEAAPRGDGAKLGNWVGAPRVEQTNQNRIVPDVARIRIIERAADQQSCRNTLFVPAHPRKCRSESVSREIAYGEASNSSVQKTVVRNPKSRVVKIQPPTDEKAPPLKATARLNVEKSNVKKPELAVIPKSVPPEAVDKAEPQSSHILSCNKAETIVGDYGFSGVKPSDCDGQVFSFNASRDGRSFLITLNALSGELIRVRKLPLSVAP